MLVELTKNDLDIIKNVLTEVFKGIHLEAEFDSRMSCTIEDTRELLAKI